VLLDCDPYTVVKGIVPESITATVAVPVLQPPKKLHNVTENVYVPNVNSPLFNSVGLVT
jgi:hypothetical protein